MPSAKTTVARGLAASIIIGSLVGGVTPSIISRIAPGSSVQQGDIVLVTNNNQVSTLSNVNPSIFVNSGAVLTFGTSGQVPGGGVKLVASGTTMVTANWLIPAKYASGAVLERVDFECDGVPIATSGSIIANQTALKQSITTGTQLRNGVAVSSGAMMMANSGAAISTKLKQGTYLSFISNPKAGTSLANCVMRPRTHEKYGR